MKIGGVRFLERRVIGEGVPLLIRYIVFRVPAFGIYLHKLVRSDHDRALHDHPWPFITILLTGDYVEVHDQTASGAQGHFHHPRWTVLLRPSEWRHRLILDKPVWTLVIVGRRQRRWGFFLPEGWCWWRKYDHRKGICEDEVIWKEGSD